MIDLSHWDTVTDWALVLKDHAFVALKATQGTGNVDAKFEESYNAIRAIDRECMVIPYHFAASADIDEEIAHFVAVFNRVIPPSDRRVWACLDLELSPLSHVFRAWCSKFTLAMQNDVTRGKIVPAPLIYSTAALMAGVRTSGDDISPYLWQAEYMVRTPVEPVGWRRTAWQYTDRGAQAGVRRVDGKDSVDLSLVNGPIAETIGITRRRYDMEEAS
jgi:GH25 family lysozyme M1 (1,4-beta-N-acetylmuramidase)